MTSERHFDDEVAGTGALLWLRDVIARYPDSSDSPHYTAADAIRAVEEVIREVRRAEADDLGDLLEGITEENRHGEWPDETFEGEH